MSSIAVRWRVLSRAVMVTGQGGQSQGTERHSRCRTRMTSGDAEIGEIDQLEELTRQIEGHTICALGDAAAWPVQGLIRHFRPEMEARIKAFKAKKESGATHAAAH